MTGRVFEPGGLLRASSAAGVEESLEREVGVEHAEANPVSQTVTVHYDEAALTTDNVRALIERFGCYRTWRLYMAAARGGFEDGSLDVAQLLLARPGAGGPAQLPLRPWWLG